MVLKSTSEVYGSSPRDPVLFTEDGLSRRPPGEGFARWQSSLQACADEPNVWVKLSGLPGETTPDWTPEGLTPFMDAALSAFGPDRCVFGSDWPASSPSSGYARWLAFVRAWLASRVDADTADCVLWHNAERFYLG